MISVSPFDVYIQPTNRNCEKQFILIYNQYNLNYQQHSPQWYLTITVNDTARNHTHTYKKRQEQAHERKLRECYQSSGTGLCATCFYKIDKSDVGVL